MLHLTQLYVILLLLLLLLLLSISFGLKTASSGQYLQKKFYMHQRFNVL